MGHMPFSTSELQKKLAFFTLQYEEVIQLFFAQIV